MPPMHEQLLDASLVWFLTVLRLAGVFVLAPFYGTNLFPVRIRVALVAAFAFIILPVSSETARLPEQADGLALLLLAFQEVALGLAMGFLCSIVFYGAQLAGELIGQQIGLSMANVLDPMSEQEVPLIGTLQMNITTMVFVLAKLDLLVMVIFVEGYRLVGIGCLLPEAFIAPTSEMALRGLDRMYWVGLQLALPVMTVMLLASVLEGYIIRTMPQMNIMVLGIPLKLAVGFFALTLTIPGVARIMLPEAYAAFDFDRPPEGILGGMLLDLSDWFRAVGERTPGS